MRDIHAVIVAAVLVLAETGCGDGLTDGTWRTVFFDNFNRDPGALSGSAYDLLVADSVTGSATIVGQRLFMDGNDALSPPALYVGDALGTRVRVSVDLVLSGAIDAGPLVLLGARSPSHTAVVENGYLCGFTATDLVLKRSLNGDSTELVSSVDLSSETSAWDSGSTTKLTFEVDGNSLSCVFEGLSTVRLSATDDSLSGGHLFIYSTTGGGVLADMHLDNLRVER